MTVLLPPVVRGTFCGKSVPLRNFVLLVESIFATRFSGRRIVLGDRPTGCRGHSSGGHHRELKCAALDAIMEQSIYRDGRGVKRNRQYLCGFTATIRRNVAPQNGSQWESFALRDITGPR